MNAEMLIEKLGLAPLPGEGGYYRETYRSREMIPQRVLPERYGCDKYIATAIYCLLTSDTFSALHRLRTDEIFHFYLGDPVTMLELFPDGSGRTMTLGNDILAGHSPQWVVPRGVWQGAFLERGGGFALLGTTMAPGFDFADFELGKKSELLTRYRDYADLIAHLAVA
jgi:uncharacterized protein